MEFDPGATHAGAPVPWLDGPRAAEFEGSPEWTGEWRRQRPGVIRLVGALAVLALCLTTVGTVMSEVLGAETAPLFPARVVAAAVLPVPPAPGTAPGTAPGAAPGAGTHRILELVTFEVRNDSSAQVRLRCLVQRHPGRSALARAEVPARGTLAVGASFIVRRRVALGIAGTQAPPAAAARAVQVVCSPVSSAAGGTAQPG